jgi:hypothetical protein
MKLSKKAIKKLKERELMLKVALALGFSEQWTVRLIDMNKQNGPLTTIKTIEVLKMETGLNQEEILEDEPIGEGATK